MFLLISTEQNTHFSVCLGKDQIEKKKTVNKPYKQSELLLKTITTLLGNDFKQLKAVFVVEGPGQFSALRIGVATANAISYAEKIPVVGVRIEEGDSLDDLWQKALLKLKKTKFSKKSLQIVKPFYDREPNIG